MADNQFDILIKFGLSKEKATEAAAELKKLEEQGKRTGNETAKSAETANAKFKDVKKSVELVGGQLGQVGQILRYVFNPGILGAAVLAKAIGSVWTAFQTFMQGLKDSSVNAARSIGNISKAMLDLDIERAKADVAFKTSMDDFERRSKRKIEVINLEKEAVMELLDTREKAELAAAKTEKEKEAIRLRYDSARKTTDHQASAKEAAARAADLKEMEAKAKQRFREGFAASGGRTPERVKLELQKLPDELNSLDEAIAEKEKIVADLSSITTPAGALPYWNDPENYKTQLQTLASSQTTLEKLRQERRRIAARKLPLTSADTAYDAADSLMGRVRTGREDLTNFQTDAQFKKGGGLLHPEGPEGKLLSAAASGADALKGGQKISQEQARAISQATQLLGLTGQSNQTILNILSRINDNQTYFQNSLKTLEQRLGDLSRRTNVGFQKP